MSLSDSLQNSLGRAAAVAVTKAIPPCGGATLFHVRDRKVTKLVHYWDHEHALADSISHRKPAPQTRNHLPPQVDRGCHSATAVLCEALHRPSRPTAGSVRLRASCRLASG